jgi:hypothetical protein
VRIVLTWVVIAFWAALSMTASLAISLPLASLPPLLALAAGFEAVFALHLNVERIGRYLQVFHEADGGWEPIAMAYGQRYPGSAPDPLSAALFLLAVGFNYIPIALTGLPPELVAFGVLHLGVAARIIGARRQAARQRVEDLERFAALAGGAGQAPNISPNLSGSKPTTT